MKLTNELKNFFTKYSEYETSVLKPTLNEIKVCLWELESPEYWNKYTTGNGIATPSPIKLITSRIKKPEKVVEKIFRKPELFPNKLSLDSLIKMHDAIGVRIIVYFSSQLSLIDRELRNSSFIELDKDNPPEAFIETEVLRKLGLSHIENRQKENCNSFTAYHYPK